MTKKTKGFTLLETLVSLGALGIVLTVTISAFLTVMTKSAKVRVVKAVESDGKYALRVMEQMVKGAISILPNSVGQTCVSGMDYLKIENLDGGITEFACLNEGTVDGFIASSSGSIDKRLTSPGVKLDVCSFDCQSGRFDQPDRVTISFGLSQRQATARVEEQADLNFETSVTLRNY
ncbi:MAG: type II secretion system protein [Candidatus Pacebacteria bacterium]|nr:type II secretion system protein [Candidatus Paceibacterota bacterium]